MMNMTILCGSIHKNQLPSSLLYSSYLFDVNDSSSLDRSLSYLLSNYKRIPLSDRLNAIEQNLGLADHLNHESFTSFMQFLD